MFEKMEHITLSGTSYPIKCDMAVLEQLQETFGSIEEFEDGILNWDYEYDENGEKIILEIEKDGEKVEYPKIKSRIPKAKNINAAVFYMVNEGMEIEGKEPPFETIKEAARAIDMPISKISGLVHKEFMRCFRRKNG